MIRVILRAAGTVVGALVLLTTAACGGAAGTPESPPAVGGGPTAAPAATTAAAGTFLPDLCNRLTAAGVADAAGVDIPLVRAEPGPGIVSCAYHLRNDDASPAIYVQYQLDAANQLDFTTSGEEVAGIGERARWYQRGATLMAKVNGDDLLIVNLGVSNRNLRGGDLRSLAVDLATRALEQLAR
ncbi:hypothetical protein [Micromonospora echinofusca]|uniref:DUF3558 domain-containing protein n=1 Tax=Micromonospora echinofusca TaxID=47858 RepID=A0ABS3VUD5_MICEH|nr:hypothetical protein [Micromonospora echinofusca]MBO4208009.1 hypothetical protein [Micromonospora echinofusca]